MKNYKSTLDLLKGLQATMLLEQETALPFGDEFNELVNATKKLSAVIDYIQEKNN